MNKLRQFLTPGWVALFAVVVVFAYFAVTVLAPWQLGKNDRLEERNHNLEVAFETDPVDVRDIVPADGSAIARDKEWHRVFATGKYLSAGQVVLRNRPVSGQPGFQTLTPFQVDDGPILLVNRGFEPLSEGAAVPPIAEAPTESVTINAFLRFDEPKPDKPPFEADGHTQVYGINTGQIGTVTDLDLATDYLQLAEGEPGALNVAPLPHLDTGPHLSYGIQWYVFGIGIPILLAWVVWREIREKRRDEEEQAELAAQSTESDRKARRAAVRKQLHDEY
ncbi:SURF1 family protein [Corynebacterium ulceribovis]|uniref:SURF1 family cytochrome oxidase biogenesis protein n=1 Tax=Corynebacterium ulceribovis TaxID=487732 RepID=UPI00037397DF|nr:SURF1 family protein [Corynebacterium ulceribovis]